MDLEAIFGKMLKAPGGFSSKELADELGCCQNTAVNKIREKILQGELQYLGKRTERNVAGQACKVNVYGVMKE